MSYTATGISILSDEPQGAGRLIRVSTVNTTLWLQCYLAREIVDAKDAASGVVVFFVAGSSTDPMLFLSVPQAEANVNYWADAFPLADANGDKIRVRILQDGDTYNTGDVWKVYTGAKDAATATVLKYSAAIFPGGAYDYGYGVGQYGVGAYGIDGTGAAGYGSVYGYGPYGYDGYFLTWESVTLPPGTYPVKVVIEDSLGNASTAFEDTITLTTYARPVTNLVVTSYDQGTDTLVLGYTATPDH